MIRVAFIARYRDATMRRKVELLAAEPDFQVHLITPRRWRDELLDVELHSGVGQGLPQTVYDMLGRANDPHRALYATLTFGLTALQPDIIHAEEEPESLAALQIALASRLFARRACLFLHTWQNLARPTKWYVNWVRNATLAASTATLCANTEAADLLRQQGYQRLTPILPAIGVDTRIFYPAAQPSPAHPTFVVGYAGRLTAEKGLDMLLAAVAQLVANSTPNEPPVELRLIGNGPLRAELAAQVQAAGLHQQVTFIPALPPAQLAPALRELDVLVLPSRTQPTWKEQFGRVLTEAMACQVAVVGSSSGAIPEVIGQAGRIFPEGAAAALAAELAHLRRNPAERQALAAAGLARVRQHYTQEIIAQQTAALYRQWAGRSPRRGSAH